MPNRPLILILRALAVAAGVPLIGLLALTLARSLHWPLIHDGATLTYIAWRIENGAVPYRDLFDMELPGIYLVHLLELRVYGLSNLGWRLFDLSVLLATAIALAAICYRYGRLAAVAAPLLYAAFHLFNGADQAGQRDYIVFLFMAYGCWMMTRYFDSSCSPAAAFAGGFLLGAAFNIKPTALLFSGGLLILMAALPEADFRRKAQGIAAYLAGGVMSVLLVAAWVIHAHAAAAFIDVLVHYIPLYTGVGRQGLIAMTAGRRHLLAPCLLVLAASLMARRGAVGERVRMPEEQRLLILGVLFGFVNFFVQGKGFLYHLYPLVGFSSCLAAIGLQRLAPRSDAVRDLASAGLRPWTALTAVAGLLLIIGLDYHYTQVPVTNKAVVPTPIADALGRDLAVRMRPGDRVQVMATSNDASLALLRLRLPESTPFLYDFQFYSSGSRETDRVRQEMMRDLTQAPPRYIVVFRAGWPAAGGYDRLRRFPEFASWLDGNYRLGVERQAYRLFVLNRENA